MGLTYPDADYCPAHLVIISSGIWIVERGGRTPWHTSTNIKSNEHELACCGKNGKKQSSQQMPEQ